MVSISFITMLVLLVVGYLDEALSLLRALGTVTVVVSVLWASWLVLSNYLVCFLISASSDSLFL